MSNEDNVRVVIRCRPLLSDLESGDVCVQIDGNQTIRLSSRQFTFDRIFGTESTQTEVFIYSAKHIVDCVLQGYNGTIFAFGQTGTGKTYTASGILSQSFEYIFDFISKSGNDTQFLVRASFYEIYNEEIRDLLSKNNTKSLELKESTQCGVYVKDLSCYVVNSVTDLDKLRRIGDKQRAIGATNMNRESSRSHSIFTITIEMIIGSDPKSSSLRVGKFHLVDLAGSERQSKTGTSGDRLKEAAKINLSLTSLSLVIAALTDSKATHIPYRNSKLTRLLSDSLGGNSKTLLIACIGPAKVNLEESVSTLRFASTTKSIKNKAVINEDAKDALLRRFQEQICELKRQLELEVDDNEGTGDQTVDQSDDNGVNGLVPNEILDKLKSLENKICVGGENLLEKAELQQKMIAESEAELQLRRSKERELQMTLEERQKEILKIEDSYETLHEEVNALNKKLKKAFFYLKDAKSELNDIQCEYEKLHEDLLDSIRTANKEIKLANAIINHYIPDSQLEVIHNASKYNDMVGEWQLRCIAYTGNNMHQTTKNEEKPPFLLQTLEDHKLGINCIDISEDKSLLITGGEDCIARLWSTFSDPCECIGILEGHQSYISCCAVHKHLVVTGSADHTIRVWIIESGQCLTVLTGHHSIVNHVICLGKFILSTSYDKTARIWSVYKNQDFCIQVFEGHKKAVTQVAMIAGDEQMLQNGDIHPLDLIVTTSTDSTARTWSLVNGECHKILIGHTGAVNCVALDPHNKRHIYTGGADSVIKCWDSITGDLLRDLKGHEGTILCLVPHNRILYSGSADHTARAWAMEYGECTRIYWRNSSSVTCVQYFEGIVYTGGSDCSARLYDSNSGTLKRTCFGHTNAVSALKVAPGRMFTGSYDGRICVWDCTGIVADSVFGNVLDYRNEDRTQGEDSVNVQNAVKAIDSYIRGYN